MSSSKRLGFATVLLAGGILASRFLGFARDAIIAALYGASYQTDAYYAAFTFPDLLAYFLTGGTLSVTFIPMFTRFLATNQEEEGWNLFSTVATTLGSLLLLATLAAEILTPTAVALVNPGFTSHPEQLHNTIQMTRIVIPAQFFLFAGGLLSATNTSRQVFWPSALAPIVYNISIITFGILLAPSIGIWGFAVGVLVGSILGPFGVPMVAALPHLKFRLHFSLRDPGFLHFVRITLPLVLGASLVTVDDWLLKYFGSFSTDGAISWLTNARKMMLLLFAVVAQAAGQAALPFFARLFAEGKTKELADLLTTSLRRVLFLSSVAAAGLIVAAQPIIFVVFRRGAFTSEDATTTSTLLILFALGLPAWSLQTIVVRGFYAREDTFTPMLVGTLTVAATAPLYWLLNHFYGFTGLATASSAAMLISAVVITFVYLRRGGDLGVIALIKGTAQGVGVGATAAAVAFAIRLFLTHTVFTSPIDSTSTLEWILLGTAMGVAFLATFLLLGHIFAIPEVEIIRKRLRLTR